MSKLEPSNFSSNTATDSTAERKWLQRARSNNVRRSPAKRRLVVNESCQVQLVPWEGFEKMSRLWKGGAFQSRGAASMTTAQEYGAHEKEERKLRIWFQKLTDIASIASSEQMLKEALAELVQDLGFDRYAYLHAQPAGIIAISNYAPEWQARYLAQGYDKIDPVVSMAKEQMKAFTWAAGIPRSVSRRVRRFCSEAEDFGIRSGISIPVRAAFGHMSMLTLASHRPAVSLKKDIDQIAAVSAVAQLHAKLEQQDVMPKVRVDLKAKQAVCLKWSAEGKTMKDIAAIEGISFATVNFHLNNARKALDAGSLAQATALATKLRLI